MPPLPSLPVALLLAAAAVPASAAALGTGLARLRAHTEISEGDPTALRQSGAAKAEQVPHGNLADLRQTERFDGEPEDNFLLGSVAIVGACFCWGTAMVFVKLDCVQSDGIATHMMAVWYSLGFLLAGVLAAIALLAAGRNVEYSEAAVLAGALWGMAKLCAFYSVTSDFGLAGCQGVSCIVYIAVTFVIGVCGGQAVTPDRWIGLGVLGAGMAVVLASRSDLVADFLEAIVPTDRLVYVPKGDGTSKHGEAAAGRLQARPVLGKPAGVCLACAAGVGTGCQLLPFEFVSVGAVSYSVGMAFGQFLVIGCTAGVAAARDAQLGDARPGLRTGLPAGLAGGILLYAAVACNAVAGAEVGIMATSASSLNMVVAGFWGIAFFGEITDWRLILLFMAGSVAAIGGGILLAT